MASYSDKQMLRDANGDLIPQYWDIQDEEFKPLTGQNGAQDTRLTGSNVEEEFVERFIFDGSKNTTNYVFPPENTRGAIVSVTIHGATGDYSSGKGFRPRLLNYVLGNRSANRALEISTEWLKSSEGIYQFYLYPGIDLKDADTRNKYNKFYTSHVFVPSVLGLFFDIDGVLSEDEGFDVSAKVMWLR